MLTNCMRKLKRRKKYQEFSEIVDWDRILQLFEARIQFHRYHMHLNGVNSQIMGSSKASIDHGAT